MTHVSIQELKIQPTKFMSLLSTTTSSPKKNQSPPPMMHQYFNLGHVSVSDTLGYFINTYQ